MKLEVGMYVRTKCGIAKITDIICGQDVKFDNDNIFEDNDDKTHHMYDGISKNDYFFKHEILGEPSFNIIDLIKVGDILEINEEKYEVIYDESYEKLGILIPSRKELSIRHSALEYVFKKYEVAIVTKEQFESMEYRIGDNK